MKKLILVSALAMSGLIYQSANAQIGVRFNINLGGGPVLVERAPVYNDDDYYYLPEVEAYYSVNQHCYYYQDNGNWISAAYLPGAYRNYDWRTANHYEVRASRPYLHNDVYRARYGGFEGRRDWNRDERSTRVYADRDRVDHNQYRGNIYGRSEQRTDDRGNYGRNDHQQPQQNDNRGNYGGRNDHQVTQQPQQPQQNDNRGNYGGRNDHQVTQQPQQNDNRGGFGGRNDHQSPQQQNSNNRVNDHGNDNNSGSRDSRQGRGGRF